MISKNSNKIINLLCASSLLIMTLFVPSWAATDLLIQNASTNVNVKITSKGDLISNIPITTGIPAVQPVGSLTFSSSSGTKLLVDESTVHVKGGVANGMISAAPVDLGVYNDGQLAGAFGAAPETGEMAQFAGTSKVPGLPIKQVAYVDGDGVFEQNGAGSTFDLAYSNISGAGIEGRTNFTKTATGITTANYFYAKDHLGSTRVAVAEDGSIVENVWYTAYGAISGRANGDLVPLVTTGNVREKFTGKEFDQEGANSSISQLAINIRLRGIGASKFAIKFSNGDEKIFNLQAVDGNWSQMALVVSIPISYDVTITEMKIWSPLWLVSYDLINVNQLVTTTSGKRISLDVNDDEIPLSVTPYDASVLENNKYTFADGVSGASHGIALDYFGARFYDPEIGIFTSTDPMGEFWNSYRYTSNPIGFTDPTGMAENDQVFFYPEGMSIPTHTGYDMGDGTVLMLTEFTDGTIDITTVDLKSYAARWGDVKYASLNNYTTKDKFVANIDALKTTLLSNFKLTQDGHWDPKGTMCIDIILNGIGNESAAKLKLDISSDFSKNIKSYTHHFPNAATIDNTMMRRNIVHSQFYQNQGNLRKQ